MTRNFKILVAAAMALTAFGAIGVAGAQAVEFHCSVQPCKLTPNLDGTAKNAHHVIIIENQDKTESAQLTCNQITGHANSATTTFSSFTLTNIAYDTCTINGSPPAVVDMNGCEYEFTASGGLKILCPVGKQIEITVTGCTFKIPAQSLTGAGYATVGSAPNREVTLSIKSSSMVVTASTPCAFIDPAQVIVGTYTTGNTLITGETSGGAMADHWYA
jgi:Tfp pilus assembly protein PilV